MQHKQLGRRARKTREEIYTAAMELFSRHGVSKVSMQDIADQAETARSTVFNHYPQKQALLSDFFMRLGNDALTTARSNNTSGFRGGIKALFQAIQEESLKVEPILREVAGMAVGNGPLAEEEAAMDKQMILFISELLELGIAAGEVHKETDVHEAAKLILCVITETNLDAINRNRVQYLADAHQKRFDILFRGLGVCNTSP